MIEAYMQATLDVLRLAGQMFLARMDDQLRWFSDDLRAFIFDLERNPRRDWRERFDAMLAEQASRACVITPESRATLIAYLEIWEQNVFGGPPQEKLDDQLSHTVSLALNDSDRTPQAFYDNFIESNFPVLLRPHRVPQVVQVRQIGGRVIGDLAREPAKALAATATESMNPWEAGIAAFLYPVEELKGQLVGGLVDSLLPPSDPSYEILFDDGTRRLILSGGPSSGAFANQAALLTPALFKGALPTASRLPASTTNPVAAIQHNADVATELTRRAVARGRLSGGPQEFGTRAHRYFERLNNRLNRRLIDEGNSSRVAAEEFRDAAGNVVSRHAPRSIGGDAVLRQVNSAQPPQVFDLKTHGGRPQPISASRQSQFSSRFGTSAQELFRQR